MRTTWKRVAAVAAVVVIVAVAAACSGLDESVSPASGGGQAAAEDYAGAPGEGGAKSGGVTDDVGASRTVVQVRSVIRTGEVAVISQDLDAAREELDDLLARLGGAVDSEKTEHDVDGRIAQATLVVRVPVDRFGAAMSGVQGLGKVERSDSTAKDVTTQVIDVDERVQTLENSLDRLQEYQRDAADIDDLIRFEQQITERESQLQSLRAQQSYLSDQTAMSTITVLLSTPETYVAPPGALDDAGFLIGLRAGWAALVNSVVVVLTVVGAALPFTVVLGLVGVPLWLLLRRAGRRDRVVPDPAAAPPAD